MKCGVVVDNFPCCPKCSNKDANYLRILEVDIAKIDGDQHFEFTTKCKKCETKFYYFLDIDLFERKSVDKKSGRYSKNTKEIIQDMMEEDFDE